MKLEVDLLLGEERRMPVPAIGVGGQMLECLQVIARDPLRGSSVERARVMSDREVRPVQLFRVTDGEDRSGRQGAQPTARIDYAFDRLR